MINKKTLFGWAMAWMLSLALIIDVQAQTVLVDFNFQTESFPSGITSVYSSFSASKSWEGATGTPGMVQLSQTTPKGETWVEVEVASCGVFIAHMKSTNVSSERTMVIKVKHQGDEDYTVVDADFKVQLAQAYDLSSLYPEQITSANPVIVRIESFTGNVQVHDLYVEAAAEGGATNTWNGSEWSLTTAPTGSDDAIIDGAYNTTTSGVIEANNLTIGESGSLTVTTGNAVIVNGDLSNSGTVSVESGGSLILLGAATGDITVVRNTTGGAGYSIVGAGVFGADLSDLNADYLYSFHEPSGTYSAMSSASMIPGEGYFAGYNGSGLVSLTGGAVSGDQTVAITKSGDGFNLLANPYAAAISINSFLSAALNTTGSVYLWDDGGQNVSANRGGDYITVNDVGTVGTSDLGDPVGGIKGTTGASAGFIGSMQGFFVEATSAGNVTFTPGMQSTSGSANADANYYRKASEEKQLLKLSISGNGLYNETLIGLMETATSGVDFAKDAKKLSGNEQISLYSMIDAEKFAIQGLPLVNLDAISVQLGLDLKEAGSFTLNVEQFSGFSENVTVSLIDTQTGVTYELDQNVSIPFTTGALANSQRFHVVFAPAKTLSVADFKNTLKVFGSQSGLTINYASNQNETVSIYSLDGKLMFNEKVSFAGNTAMITPSINQNQIYILRINKDTIKFIIK